jgi:hypothetical protein
MQQPLGGFSGPFVHSKKSGSVPGFLRGLLIGFVPGVEGCASLGQVLHAIWNLSDVDKDGALTLAEFALAKHFIKMKLEGQDLPPTLPPGFA